MVKKLLGTIGTRYLVALLNLILIMVNAKVLGLKGVGLVGILIASVNIVVIICGIFSGNTLVYFMGRHTVRTLFPIAYGWTVGAALIACALMYLPGLIPAGYFGTVWVLALLNSLVTANARFLLGKDRIKAFNIVYVLQGAGLFVSVLCLYYLFDRPDIHSFIYASYLSSLLAFVVSLIWVIPYLKEKENAAVSALSVLREMFTYGLWASADNLAENLTTRLNYFLLQYFGGLGSVGLLDSGTKVSESVWHISRSVSLLEYNSVAKTTDLHEQKTITLRFFKFTLLALVLVMGCIALIPEWVYTEVLFRAEFAGVRQVILALSIGIIAFGCNNVLSHFFIGSGRVRTSAACSALGLLALSVAALLLIPHLGALGAAISCSIAFSVMLLFSLSRFIRLTQATFADFIPSRNDFKTIYRQCIKK
ncbi:polysaccharide biosynthesis C-terminal domain-containing protein [Parabacteroides sp. PF5-6]|uniref:lipopolysaccharide biosynthesis protein n=1 Tax=Parabacteroides sp. PF5-6 TaxID=1742403 RepID=UPI00240577DC|nr:polysaccharide biosynthesis C-terminal domain-containing protein [Parabacteroides sp. PF5-6]MDF9830886.1 O-antigen/teichoic acid export membrane protein [Parabacteroides sp. PF5-6]